MQTIQAIKEMIQQLKGFEYEIGDIVYYMGGEPYRILNRRRERLLIGDKYYIVTSLEDERRGIHTECRYYEWLLEGERRKRGRRK